MTEDRVAYSATKEATVEVSVSANGVMVSANATLSFADKMALVDFMQEMATVIMSDGDNLAEKLKTIASMI